MDAERMLKRRKRVSASFLPDETVRRMVCVYDCRFGSTEVKEKWLDTHGLDFNDFLQRLQQELPNCRNKSFVLTTTDRIVLDYDKFAELQDGSTVHLLQKEDQALSAATKEHINFTPHHDTLIRSGMYEYYASEGQNSLPYALAELIDNALAATAKNTTTKTIEIRLLFDESAGKPAVVVLDNGSGMNSKQLSNWAVFRLSKFSKDKSKSLSRRESYVRPDPVPRSLNSDISYFGAGGKQAVFYIADATRMISKPVGFPDVHELVLSKEDFERKERNNEDVYSGIIRNRKPGDSSHVEKNDERFLHSLIAEESQKKSFTAVVMTGIHPKHVEFLKKDFEVWTRQLAHIYHYYIHGAKGNDIRSSSTDLSHLPKIDIQITLREKPPRCPRVLNLREVDNDMQTLYISTAADTFEFKASTEEDDGSVEGVIRYHPFLYDKETYPKDSNAVQASRENDDDDDDDDEHGGRGKRPIFDCFWNGRRIPYTAVSEFDWCAWSKVSKIPAECFNRISGVLFTNDRFEVSTNKLTFMDLELKLKKKETIFTRVVNGQEENRSGVFSPPDQASTSVTGSKDQPKTPGLPPPRPFRIQKQRANIQKEFSQWLQSCHEKWDKQIHFVGYKETITRTDVPTKKMQHPWATFSSIECDGKVYKAGQLVKSQKTLPILYGTVTQFLLYGQYKGDVFATGGQVEVVLEPRALHDKSKTIPISKIDRTATEEAINKHISEDSAKLPEKLKVEWPDGNPWKQNAVCPAGTPLGPLKVEILNMKEESLSRMPSMGQWAQKKLAVELKVVEHRPDGDHEVFSIVAPHTSCFKYWFKRMDTLTQMGKYTLSLNTAISESHATVFGGRPLPSYSLDFTIKEGNARSFNVGEVRATLQVGVPFDIPLLMKDEYDHPAAPPPNLKPVLKCSGLDLTYEKVDRSGKTLTIRSVKARGKVQDYQTSKPYDLKVTLPGMKKDTQTISFVLLPGKPHSIHVTPEDDPITAENGNPAKFLVEIHDEAGNITVNPKQVVRCQVEGLPIATTDCSSTGAGQLETRPLNLKIIKGEPQELPVKFEMLSNKNVPSVERMLKVLPSTRVSSMELYSQDDENLVLRNKEQIEWPAGGLLENLFYRLYDEAGRELRLTEEIGYKIKVNWTREANLEDVVMGKLPDIQVPTQVQEKRFYQVSYQDSQSVSVSFDIVPCPDEPTRLKATLPQTTVKLGETLPGSINLDLVDQYDNVTKTLTSAAVKHMRVEAEGLDKETIVFSWQKSSSSILVSGVQFQLGALGSRELRFTYKSFVERVVVIVTAGLPAKLRFVSEPEMPLQVLNGHGIPTPFVLQLCDEWGNPSPDQRVVVELKSSPLTLKVKSSVISQPVNAEGKASFTVSSLSGTKGYYQLLFRGSFNKSPIPGPTVNLTVLPDPHKPVSLSVEFDSRAKLPAGGKFPVFSLTVVSDEGRPMTTFNPAAASMWLWSGVPAGKAVPQMATELKCSKPMEDEKNDCVHFRDKDIPERVGKYTVQFSLRMDKVNVMYSKEIPIDVVSNQPAKLGPDSQPRTPVVFYSTAVVNRTLVENMTLRIMDSHGNPAGEHLDGKVRITVKNTSNSRKLPLLEGASSKVDFDLEGGKAHIPRLAITENSPGEDGSSYVLLFQPEALLVPTPLAPFELPFHFYNDVENQQKMSELTRKKDELAATVSVYKTHIANNDELSKLLNMKHLDANRKEAYQRSMLNTKNMIIKQSVSLPVIDRLVSEKNAEVCKILEMPRRVFSIAARFRGQQDVLGMVGHLAFVQDEAAAWVLSWQMRGDMDCVVTRTIAAAERIYKESQGRQQVLPLENVSDYPANRFLPHIRNGRSLFNPPGNPTYARDLLIYPQDPESCSVVFKSLLRDTILIDDLSSANTYRKAMVQSRINCPTILTRQGDRVSSIGKFGGAQNKAPPITTLKVFGAPYPQVYYTLKEQIDMLGQYQETLKKMDEAAKEYDSHQQLMNSPEMLRQHQELEEKNKQLNDIERLLSNSVRTPKRSPPENSAGPSGIKAKRTKRGSF